MRNEFALAGKNTVDSKHDSTYYILKSLSPGRKMRDLPKAADAAMICTDATYQQAKNKSAREAEITDNMITKVGVMLRDVKNVQEQTKDVESPPITTNFIDDVNQSIDRTNTDSSNQWNVKEKVEKLVTDNNISVDKILTAHSKGSITSDQLIQKMREQLEKAKNATANNPDSIEKQLAQLARERAESERVVNNQHKEVHGMTSRYSVKTPDETNKFKVTNQDSNVTATNTDATRSSEAPVESGHRGPGSSKR